MFQAIWNRLVHNFSDTFFGSHIVGRRQQTDFSQWRRIRPKILRNNRNSIQIQWKQVLIFHLKNKKTWKIWKERVLICKVNGMAQRWNIYVCTVLTQDAIPFFSLCLWKLCCVHLQVLSIESPATGVTLNCNRKMGHCCKIRQNFSQTSDHKKYSYFFTSWETNSADSLQSEENVLLWTNGYSGNTWV